MSLGAVTLAGLALAIVLSCTSRLNVGVLALALAWLIGVYVGDLPLREVTGGFPVDLFLTLAGVTLLFAQAQVNGTLDIVAQNAMPNRSADCLSRRPLTFVSSSSNLLTGITTCKPWSMSLK